MERGDSPPRVTVLADSLSPRDRDVLRLLTTGASVREVARRLGLGYSTVRGHVRTINATLGAGSIAEAIELARRHGLDA